jgi:tetratricopeptide (TPR) repeat protein
MNAPKPAEAGRPPRGSSKVAKPHLLENVLSPLPPAAAAPLSPADMALRIVDHGDAPPALGGRARDELAWALKDVCYAAWNTDPRRAAAAADALAALAGRTPAPRAGPTATDALARWTAGIAQIARGDMASATSSLDAAQVLFQQLGDTAHAIETQVPKIMALAMLGELAAAADCAELTRQAFVQRGDLRAASKVSLNLGSLHYRRDAYAEAARHYRDAAVGFARVRDPEHSVMADIGLAGAQTALGDLGEAARIFARARARAAAHTLPVVQAIADEWTALLDLARGRYGAALAGLESARRRYAELEMPQHVAIAEKQLADVYLQLRLLPEALALFDESLARFETLAMPGDAAWTLAQRGRTLALLGRREAAAQAFVRAAGIFETQNAAAGKATVTLARAELLLEDATADSGTVDTVLELATEAALGHAAAGYAEGRARADVVSAQALLRAGRIVEADALFAATLARARSADMLSVQVRCLTGAGLVATRRGDSEAARAAFEGAAQLFEDQRRALPGDDMRGAFLADHLEPYRGLLRLALQAHARDASAASAEDVLHSHERFHARVLGDRLGQPAGEVDAQAGAHELNDLRGRYNWLYRRAHATEGDSGTSPELLQALRHTERELLERSRRSRLATAAKADDDGPGAIEDAFDPQALFDALGPHDALVEFGVLDDELFALIVRTSGVSLQRNVAPWTQVADAARSARFQLEALGQGGEPLQRHIGTLTTRANARLAQLHALVWAPIAAALADVQRVMLVLPQGLGAVPFSALCDESGQPLAEKVVLARAPSARVALHGLRRRPADARRALVLAESSRLPHAAAEAERAASLFPKAEVFINAQATVAALREHAAQADVIHFACHARFRHDNPAFSALHLHDAALTAELAETLPLAAAPTVVLSGCETGLAGPSIGDEMTGLVRAFLVAGAARVLASLWPVQDEITALFMHHFHGALARGQPAAAALRQAQRAVRQAHPHPFHWAPFVLHGGW